MFGGVPQFGSIKYWSHLKKTPGTYRFFWASASRTEKNKFPWDTLHGRSIIKDEEACSYITEIIYTIRLHRFERFASSLDLDFACHPKAHPPRDRLILMILGSSCQLLVQWAYEITVIQVIKEYDSNRSGNCRIHENWRSPHHEPWISCMRVLRWNKTCDADILYFLVFDTQGVTGCSCWPPTALGCYGASGESPGWWSLSVR